MNINQRIVSAFDGYLPIEADVYKGDANIYLVFNYTELPADFGDDDAEHYRYLVQLHLYAPHGTNTVSRRREIVSRLVRAGFTRPSTTPASDVASQHYVFECEDAEGVFDYG